MLMLDLEQLIAKELTALGYTLYGLEMEGQSHNKLLRLYIERIDSKAGSDEPIDTRVSIEDCSKISYYINKFLGVVPNFNNLNYTLEVSSPGVERKLLNLEHFNRALGKNIKIKLKTQIDGRSNFIGELIKVDSILEQVFLKVDEQIICLDYNNILKANLLFTF